MIIVALLLPIAGATVIGVFLTWPHHPDRHLNAALVTTASKGLTLLDATTTTVRPTSCQAIPGDSNDTPAAAPGAPICSTVTVHLTQGPEKGQTRSVLVDDTVTAAGVTTGTGILVSRTAIAGQPAAYNYVDIQRGLPLSLLTAVFVLVVIGVARWKGLWALIGLGYAAVVLLLYALPAMISGSNPLIIALLSSLAIVLVVLYTTHGFNVRSSTALLGTIAGLAMAAGLAALATHATHLTGASSDSDYALHSTAPDLNLKGVVLAGMVIAGLGVLNDITITQASAVWELAEAGVAGRRDLYRRAMRIGRDHVASAVYTIAFVWAGASLSTLLLIAVYDRPLLQTAQSEIIASDIVSTLVGATALVLAMPLTTLIAATLVGGVTDPEHHLATP